MSKRVVILNDFEINLLKGISKDFISKIKNYELSKQVPKDFRHNLLITWENIFRKLNSSVLYEKE